jgi:plasmid stabilization system protein ParE
MVTVEWSSHARNQVQEIYNYLYGVAGERTARKITGKIQSHTEILSANPRAGQKEEILAGYDMEFRYLVEGNSKIVYRLEHELATIAMVFDCRQNPEKMREELRSPKY